MKIEEIGNIIKIEYEKKNWHPLFYRDLATGLHKEMEKECILARIEELKHLRIISIDCDDDFTVEEIDERIARLKQGLITINKGE